MLKYLIGIFSVIICFCTSANAHKIDSVRMEQRKGLEFIVHKVEPKETLFSISRRYKVKVKSILEYNETLENGLKMFQEIFIPYNFRIDDIKENVAQLNNIHIVQAKETMYFISSKYNISIEELKKLNNLEGYDIGLGDTLIVKENGIDINYDSNKSVSDSIPETKASYHIIEPSETLYSISLKYGIDIQDIKDWNNLTSNILDIGQKINLRKDNSDSTVSIAKPINAKKTIDTLYVFTDNSRFKKKIETNDNIEKTLEEGFATKIDQTEDTRKYLALHRNAPIGSVIEVKNQMTNLSIYARVVGKLPETGLNQNILIRLSYAAFNKLGALDSKIPVVIGYVIE